MEVSGWTHLDPGDVLQGLVEDSLGFLRRALRELQQRYKECEHQMTGTPTDCQQSIFVCQMSTSESIFGSRGGKTHSQDDVQDKTPSTKQLFLLMWGSVITVVFTYLLAPIGWLLVKARHFNAFHLIPSLASTSVRSLLFPYTWDSKQRNTILPGIARFARPGRCWQKGGKKKKKMHLWCIVWKKRMHKENWILELKTESKCHKRSFRPVALINGAPPL